MKKKETKTLGVTLILSAMGMIAQASTAIAAPTIVYELRCGNAVKLTNWPLSMGISFALLRISP